MESVGILRVLWRRRALAALGFLLALAAGVLGLYRVSLAPPELQSRTAVSSSATQRLLVDTSNSLVADARPKGVDSILTRMLLVGNLIASDRARATLGREASLRPAEIGTIGPAAQAPGVPTPLAEGAIEVARPKEPYVVAVKVEDPSLPILSVFVTTPDPRSAKELAGAATIALAAAARRSPFAGDAARVERVGKPTIGSRASGFGKAKAIAVVLVLFIVWCAAIVILDSLLRHAPLPSAWTGGDGARA